MTEQPLFDLTLLDAAPTGCAVISDDELYRYSLRRWWEPAVVSMTFIMLNPSIADATTDDQTIRRSVTFARREGYGGIHVDPVGPENDRYLRAALTNAAAYDAAVVAAWGSHGRPGRVAVVEALAASHNVQLQCLGTTAFGAPRHPSRLANDTPLIPWLCP